ncbi:MAG: hypothetical protein DRP08_01090 [Candidatus Aenigmatarchaeota archaeon]|nr:MAG: hypothetical protein DRP08_01090 [Candidatus Aenigmarchaeota archaeon]
MRFEHIEEYLIKDNDLNLIWEKTPREDTFTYEEALDLVLVEDDWRLPTISELFSLIDHDRRYPAIHAPFLCDCGKHTCNAR